MTPQKIADLTRGKLESFIPDLCEGLESEWEKHDAFSDFATDWLYDRYGEGIPHIIRQKAVTLLADEFFGERK